jgi:signal transduction histidine kinase
VLQSALQGRDRKRALQLVDDLDATAADMYQSTQHLNAMLTNLRTLGKPRMPGDGQLAEEADPLPILRHAMSVCQELAIKVGASMGYHGPTALPRVRMSATELTQVLINVIQNGAQAVGARGTHHGNVSVMARPEHSMLELEIRDDGVGIPRDVLERVGTPFFTTRKDGTGLGLAQCQRLVGTAGGRLRIESEVGVGTTVIITLPIAA